MQRTRNKSQRDKKNNKIKMTRNIQNKSLKTNDRYTTETIILKTEKKNE